MTERSIISNFVYDYERDDGSRLSAEQKSLLAEALETFLIHEHWMSNHGRCAAIVSHIDDLQRVLGAFPTVLTKLSLIRGGVSELQAAVERSDEANCIMQEHLTEMSEQLRLLRRN